ncbi:pirin family protein [Maricaulis maris]|uniref:pirin family protein n=1 Tax=Maricaulis maris TaxID=74318 RepID=UPI0026F06FAE|nr:pirin family protein [Maricaulis maris]
MSGMITQKFAGKPKDLGGFGVRRVLPFARQRMVGPFIFFDQMGPAEFAPGQGIDVRPHPHIGLATVTYLFEGALGHRDSLGEDLVIRPGDVNWMTAGRGVVHSERTPAPERAAGHRMFGIQTWVALPEDKENIAPAFHHHKAATLPVIERGESRFDLILGNAWDRTAPVEVFSPIFYLHGLMPAGSGTDLDIDHAERAVYVVEGEVTLDGEPVAAGEMAVLEAGSVGHLMAGTDSRVMLCGGDNLGPRHINWNFVAADRAAISEARQDWSDAARDGFPTGGRFALPPGETEHIPLPD